MEKENILNPLNSQIIQTLKKSWILLLIFFITEIVVNFGIIENNLVSTVIYTSLFSLIFCWYFIINKKWQATIITFLCATVFSIINSNILNYYMVSELKKENDSLPFMLLQITILFISSSIITYQFLKNSTHKIKTKTFIGGTLITITFLFACKNIFIESLLLDLVIKGIGLGFMINFIYSVLTTIYVGTLIVTYYLLINNYQYNGLLTNPDSDTLKKVSNYFIYSFPILYTGLLLTVLNNLFDLKLNSATYFYIQHSLYEYLKLLIILITPLIFIICISQVLREKAKNENSFFGIFGVLLYIPIINILFYLLLVLNSKFTVLHQDKIHTNKVLHIILGLLLVILYYIYQNNNSYIGVSASEVIIALGILIIGVIRVGKIWVVAIGIALLSFLFFDLSSLSTEAPVYFGENQGNPLWNSIKNILEDTPKFLIVIFIKTFQYATYLYILRYTFLTEEEWNE